MLIRLIGPAEECAAALDALRNHPTLSVTDASSPYPCHRDPAAVRIYVDAKLIRHRGGRPRAVPVVTLDPDDAGIARAMRWRR